MAEGDTRVIHLPRAVFEVLEEQMQAEERFSIRDEPAGRPTIVLYTPERRRLIFTIAGFTG